MAVCLTYKTYVTPLSQVHDHCWGNPRRSLKRGYTTYTGRHLQYGTACILCCQRHVRIGATVGVYGQCTVPRSVMGQKADSSWPASISTHSTTEAELVAADRCAQAVVPVCLRRLLMFDSSPPCPILPTTPLFEDSQCCIDVARGGGSFKKLRHIPCRRVLHLPLHCAIEPSLSLHYVRSRDSLADIFT